MFQFMNDLPLWTPAFDILAPVLVIWGAFYLVKWLWDLFPLL